MTTPSCPGSSQLGGGGDTLCSQYPNRVVQFLKAGKNQVARGLFTQVSETRQGARQETR